MDQLQTRLDALEQQMATMTRRLRWWRGLAGGLLGVAVLTWALPSSKAADAPPGLLADRVAALQDTVSALQDKLRHITAVTSQEGLNEVVITGANLRLVNGLGSTDCTDEEGNEIPDCPNGVGNLIVGYNEIRSAGPGNVRTGSHNVVVGQEHDFSRFGGLVVGRWNQISGDFAVVTGGGFNMASAYASSVHGGTLNVASGPGASVGGGAGNHASGDSCWIGGGSQNTANGFIAVVSGGAGNTASGDIVVVSGGRNRTAEGEFDWVAGPLFADE